MDTGTGFFPCSQPLRLLMTVGTERVRSRAAAAELGWVSCWPGTEKSSFMEREQLTLRSER